MIPPPLVFLGYGMTYIFRYLPALDGNWGALDDEKKNLWNGMIGMVQRRVS